MTTLHVSDIRADLERGDTAGIEDAFRALVGWPNEGVICDASAEERRQLLWVVSETLVSAENGRVMPRDTFDAIVDEAEDMDGGTYADGARAVLRHRAFFDRLAIIPAWAA